MKYMHIREKINNGSYQEKNLKNPYPVGHVFDENKSVKWNREKQEQEHKNYIETARSQILARQGFRDDLTNSLLEYGFNELQADVIIKEGWERGSYRGFGETLNQILDIVDIISRVQGLS